MGRCPIKGPPIIVVKNSAAPADGVLKLGDPCVDIALAGGIPVKVAHK